MSGFDPRRALLVDDERLARRRLRRLLAAHPGQIEVVAEAAGIAEAVEALSTVSIDVIFLDVRMRGETGFDLFDACRVECHVVFVTAFDSYAVRAFEVNAVDYLVKPVAPARLAACIERLGTPRVSTTPIDDGDRIYVKVDGGHSFIALTELLAVRAVGDYTELVLADGRTPWTRMTMVEWQNRLDPARFMRVHRSAIVRLGAVERLEKSSGRDFTLWVSGWSFPVSRTHLSALRRRLL